MCADRAQLARWYSYACRLLLGLIINQATLGFYIVTTEALAILLLFIARWKNNIGSQIGAAGGIDFIFLTVVSVDCTKQSAILVAVVFASNRVPMSCQPLELCWSVVLGPASL